LSPDALCESDVLVHAAAETAGGWAEHQRNSLDATEHVLRAASAAGIRRVVHVSSLAVLARATVVGDATPLEPDGRSAGPYVWGKLESERMAVRLGEELGIAVKVVRPGAIVDYDAFEAPGRLGRQLGPLFVAVGSPREQLGVVDLAFSAATLAWLVERFEDAPAALNLLTPELPTKRALVERLRRSNPDLTVLWLPTALLVPLSWMATGLQRVLRPRVPPISLRKVFAGQRYDTTAVRVLAPRIAG
jgi:nucleoside-diphosphate-sugar epimerase